MLFHDTSQNIEDYHHPYDSKSINWLLSMGTTFRILNITFFLSLSLFSPRSLESWNVWHECMTLQPGWWSRVKLWEIWLGICCTNRIDPPFVPVQNGVLPHLFWIFSGTSRTERSKSQLSGWTSTHWAVPALRKCAKHIFQWTVHPAQLGSEDNCPVNMGEWQGRPTYINLGDGICQSFVILLQVFNLLVSKTS